MVNFAIGAGIFLAGVLFVATVALHAGVLSGAPVQSPPAVNANICGGNTVVGNTTGNTVASSTTMGNTFGNTVAFNTVGNTVGSQAPPRDLWPEC
jgi:hypothetical protein